MTVATARANSNIALVKYWGKADQRLILPTNSSLSLTLDAFYTTTSVTFGGREQHDRVFLDNHQLSGVPLVKVTRFLDLVREMSGSTERATVISTNHVPTAAGLASSSSAFAALALAATTSAGLSLTARELSILARKGSGSASRSIFGGLALWNAGNDDLSSFAEPVPAGDLGLAFVVALIATGEKAVSSREAMQRTVQTSPFYPAWVTAAGADMNLALDAIGNSDFDALGQVVESNSLRMHATMLAARPPVNYWLPETVSVLHRVAQLRDGGLAAYATMDAGPNVKILVRNGDQETVTEALRETLPGVKFVSAGPGPGVRLVDGTVHD